MTTTSNLAVHPQRSTDERRPQIWGNIPPRNPHFTGRRDLLDQLRKELAGAAVLPQTLHGLGGVGKTALAVEYVYRYADQYELVWWIPSESPAQVSRALVDLAQAMGLPADEADAVRALSSGAPHRKWLLIFDNADDPADLAHLIPSGSSGHVLITSRNRDWEHTTAVLDIDYEPPLRDQLFICYSHRDSAMLEQIRVHLTALKRGSSIKTWDDTQIVAGAKWRTEIQSAISTARVALLLVSPDFLASNFVMNEEVPALLKAAEDDGVAILCVIVRHCLYERFPSLNQFQAVNSPKRPLAALPKSQRERELVRIATIIEEALTGKS